MSVRSVTILYLSMLKTLGYHPTLIPCTTDPQSTRPRGSMVRTYSQHKFKPHVSLPQSSFANDRYHAWFLVIGGFLGCTKIGVPARSSELERSKTAWKARLVKLVHRSMCQPVCISFVSDRDLCSRRIGKRRLVQLT